MSSDSVNGIQSQPPFNVFYFMSRKPAKAPFRIISVEVRANSFFKTLDSKNKEVKQPTFPYNARPAGRITHITDGEIAILHMEVDESTKTAEGIGKTHAEALTRLVAATIRTLGVEKMNETRSTPETITAHIQHGLRQHEAKDVKGPMQHMYAARVTSIEAFVAQHHRPAANAFRSYPLAA